ncbi:hypothetical protein [Streptomyces spongiae]|uniref:Uncharacterized protein n=1 Tax=Streptomyces spongiae TaxID=565072 RepID=A0A5N8XYN8_9ACTN|nr:hypothetical protein [Streptomyces spongiae]MPY64467.1 hypothetical protein [Streptomyces spongiae]
MRRAATVLLGALAVVGALSAPAVAVPDPVATVDCVAQTPADLAGLIDPAAPGVPSEIPGTACLAP